VTATVDDLRARSFAHYTIVERKPQIIRQVIQHNDYPPEVVQALQKFREEIDSEPIGTYRDKELSRWNTVNWDAPDGKFLQAVLARGR
jgi:hypothetical protein